jgi:putative Holliday junction resolvase
LKLLICYVILVKQFAQGNCKISYKNCQGDKSVERYVAYDIGDKRIGVAISDPFNTYALPSQTYFRKGFKVDIQALVDIAKEKGATAIICGLPVNFDGSDALQTEKTQRFIDALKEACAPIPIICEDERFTTMMAHETLISEGMRREKRKNYVDALAAANILDGFLNKLNNKK